MAVFTFLHPGYTCVYMPHVCLYYNMCPSLLGQGSSLQPADRLIDQYVRTRSRLDTQPYVRFDRVGSRCQGGKESLPCVRRYNWWVPAVRGRIIFFARNMDALPCVRRCSWWVPAVRGKHFFAKYGGPSSESPLSGGGIIILRIIRRHFLAAAMDPAVSLSTYSTLRMEVFR